MVLCWKIASDSKFTLFISVILFQIKVRSYQLYHITTCIKLKLLIMEMNFQNFRNAEPWVAFRFVEYQTIHWFKPCLSDKYRFCLFLKNCDEWIKYKVNFVVSWFARRVFCNVFLSDKLRLLWFLKAVSAYFHDIVEVKSVRKPRFETSSQSLACLIRVFWGPGLCNSSVSLCVVISWSRSLHYLTALLHGVFLCCCFFLLLYKLWIT